MNEGASESDEHLDEAGRGGGGGDCDRRGPGAASGGAGLRVRESSDKSVLRIGWGQDPQTLNPFVGLDEEDFTIWALSWEPLLLFSTEDLSPVAGIAEDWEVSEDGKTVTFTLADRNWSDGEPITSADVKYSLETLGEEGDLFAGYTSNVTSIETLDDKTVVIQTKQPDTRVVGGVFVYMLRSTSGARLRWRSRALRTSPSCRWWVPGPMW